MTTLLDRLQGDLNVARKAQDRARLLVLGTILSEVRNRDIELRRPVTDEDTVEVIRRAIKRRRESIEIYDSAGRQELADKEAAEATILEEYLPAQAGADEIRVAVRAAIAAGAGNIGAVMGQVMPAFKGRADGGLINGIVREELAARG